MCHCLSRPSPISPGRISSKETGTQARVEPTVCSRAYRMSSSVARAWTQAYLLMLSYICCSWNRQQNARALEMPPELVRFSGPRFSATASRKALGVRRMTSAEMTLPQSKSAPCSRRAVTLSTLSIKDADVRSHAAVMVRLLYTT